MKKKDYLGLFKRKNDGSYAYEGRFAETSLDEADYRRVRRRFFLWGVLPVAAGIAAGCFPPAVMPAHILVMAPFAVALIFSFRMLLCGIRLFEYGNTGRLREYIYRRTLLTLPKEAAVITASTAILAVVCQVLKAVRGGDDPFSMRGILWLVCVLVMTLSSLMIRKEAAIMNFRIKEEEISQ